MSACQRWSFASEPFLFLYMFILGANSSLLPQLVISKLCHKEFNATVCSSLGKRKFLTAENLVYDHATRWNTVLYAAVCIPSAITILPVGAISDLVCRKKILLIPTSIVFIQSLVFLLCSKFKQSSIAFLAVGTSITSVYGDVQGAVMLAYAYMASVTPSKDSRTVRMTVLEGGLFVGQGLGSFTSGLLAQRFGFVAAFALVTSVSILNILFVAFFLPAVQPTNITQSESEKEKIDLEHNGLGKNVVDRGKLVCFNLCLFIQKYIIECNGIVVSLLAVAFFANSAILGENIIATLFIKHSPLNLSPEQVGLYYLILHCIRGIGIMCLAIAVSRCFNPSDYLLITIGSLSLIASHVSLSFASTVPMLYCFTLFSIAFPFTMSATRAMLTKHVKREEQGTVLSFVGVISLVGATIMTFASNYLFRATAVIFPGFSILLLAGSSFLSLIIISCLWIFTSRSTRSSEIGPKHELQPLMENDK